MPLFKNIHFIPYHVNALTACVEDLFNVYEHLLPDLHQITIFLPSTQNFQAAREKITNQASRRGCDAILLPHLCTLRNWVFSKYALKQNFLSQYTRELILVDALKTHAGLFNNANPWNLASELLSFFDALTRNNISANELNSSFSNNDKLSDNDNPLSQEASLVVLLYKAWKEQLDSDALVDPVRAYVDALQNITVKQSEIYFGVGLDKLSKSECELLVKLDINSNFYLYMNSNLVEHITKPDKALSYLYNLDTQKSKKYSISSYSVFFNQVFSDRNISIKERASAFSTENPSSQISTRLSIFKTASFEQHVKAIDVWIRNNIFKNNHNIGVVTSDRKLARRLRAILEHANLSVNDLGGWALSTTSTAVIIQFWLDNIENNFPSKELLAVLKSPFFPLLEKDEFHNIAIDYFEKFIILNKNISGGLKKIHSAIDTRLDAIDYIESGEEAKFLDYISTLLENFRRSVEPLTKIKNAKHAPIHLYFQSLLNSLKTAGIYTLLRNDAAGLQIIELLEQQYSNFCKINNELNWHEWRRLLARILDQQNFKPSLTKAKVTLCSIEQSQLQDFDALVIASVDQEHFSGTADNYVFLNESIRSELRIPTWQDDREWKFYLFRCLLDAAPEILITVQTERNGEHTQPCPWLEAIETFHFMAYGKDLTNPELEMLVTDKSTTIQKHQKIALPTSHGMSSAILREELKPTSLSISQYQLLMSCPYQFFIKVGLKLSKTLELMDELDKGDFGSLVHKSIYAFFSNVPKFPGPFKEKVTNENRASAELLLKSISNKVFQEYLGRGFSNHLWLQRWQSLIPKFIDWEISRQKEFEPYQQEASIEKNISKHFSLHGRVDRIDKYGMNYAIIDYKTGQTASKKEILAGEEVQLPSYALLNDESIQVEFVSIGKNNTVKSESILKSDELEELIHLHHHRLTEITKHFDNNVPLQAFADDETCKYCDYRGICRKDFWNE